MKVQIGDKTYNVPDGAEVKIIEDKPKRKFKVGDYVSYDGGIIYIKSIGEHSYSVKVIKCPNGWELPAVAWIGFGFEPDMELLPDYEEIIDEWGDAHDPELRKKINDAWNKNREGFRPILCALYARDIDEITDHDAFSYDEWLDTPEYRLGLQSGCDWQPYMEMVLKYMRLEWDFFASNYLNHIADDCDLECILNFLHYPYLPVYQK